MGYGYPVGLRGEEFYQAAITALSVGQPVDLVPEPGNEHDPRAVRVEADGRLIGYVPRDNWTCRVLHDERGQLVAAVMKIFENEAGLMEVVLAANSPDRLPPMPDVLPPITGTVEITCGCGQAFPAPVVGLNADTGLNCPGCAEPVTLPEDVMDDIAERFLDTVVETFYDNDLDPPDDDVICLMRRIGHWPSVEEMLIS